MPYLIKMMLFSFLITAAVEVPLSLLFGARKKGLLIVLIVNLITNPPAVFLSYLLRAYLPRGLYLPLVLLMECAVILIEWGLYRRTARKLPVVRKPLLAAAVLNVTSYLSGVILNRLI
ncbi:MAG: hypothetical protein IJM76_06370 [Lachnospiraceae bacterium]|nr:hypothetical protein [Lachnospiraceae bacterium]